MYAATGLLSRIQRWIVTLNVAVSALSVATGLLSHIQRCTVILNNVAALALSIFLDEIPRPMCASTGAIGTIKEGLDLGRKGERRHRRIQGNTGR